MKTSCVQRGTGQTLSGILSLVDLNNALRSSYSAAERDACRVPFSVWSHDSMRCVLRWVHLQNDVYTTRVQPNAAWARISLLVCLFVCEYLVLITYIYIYRSSARRISVVVNTIQCVARRVHVFSAVSTHVYLPRLNCVEWIEDNRKK